MKRKNTSIFTAALIGFSPLGYADNLGADDQAKTVPAGQDAVPTNDENIVNPEEDEEIKDSGESVANDQGNLKDGAAAAGVDNKATMKKADGIEVDVTDRIEVQQNPAQKADGEASATLIAAMMPTEGNKTKGTVTFSANSEQEGVTVMIKMSGLEPGSMHAIHIHQFGDVSAPDGTSAGGHFNPDGHEHGLPEEDMRHAGDLGNLEADETGMAMKTMTVTNFTLMGMPNSILGRAVVVHAGEDKGTQPTGDAGARIAVGVIGVQSMDLPGEKEQSADKPEGAKPNGKTDPHAGQDHEKEMPQE